MNKKQALQKYEETAEKLKAYRLVVSTTYFDKMTIAPRMGNEYRNRMLAIIAGELFAIQNDPEFIEAVLYLAKQDLGEVRNRDVYLTKKALENTITFTQEETMAYELARMESSDAWRQAKQQNDYSLYEDKLIRVIEMTKERALKRDPDKKPYDILLDDFEEGMDMKKYDEFFAQIKKELLPLIRKVNRKQNKGYIDDSFLYRYYPIDKQAEFSKQIMNYIGFKAEWGYLGTTEHPFTDCLSRNDVRVTTHYKANSLADAIFSTIHECGHGFHGHQLSPKYDKCLSMTETSSGMAESQSRFLENYIGRKEAFFVDLYPRLQKLFPENLSDVTLDAFIKAINVSRCSLIRTEADELTYPIHILIRYELEKETFAGRLPLKDLDKAWDERYEKYLGIRAKKPSEGILQDIHWSEGSFGYFPTYALGSAIGAQLLHAMGKQLDVDKLLKEHKIKAITDYLKVNVHQYGAMYNYDEMLKRVTGEGFDPKYYIDYLKDKYSKLYGIE